MKKFIMVILLVVFFSNGADYYKFDTSIVMQYRIVTKSVGVDTFFSQEDSLLQTKIHYFPNFDVDSNFEESLGVVLKSGVSGFGGRKRYHIFHNRFYSYTGTQTLGYFKNRLIRYDAMSPEDSLLFEFETPVKESNISVPYGVYDCYKTLMGWLRINETFISKNYFYFAPGIGMVREDYYDVALDSTFILWELLAINKISTSVFTYDFHYKQEEIPKKCGLEYFPGYFDLQGRAINPLQASRNNPMILRNGSVKKFYLPLTGK